MTIEGEDYTVSGGFGRTIVDSGTTFSYFPSRIFRSMKTKLAAFCQSHGFQCSQNCFAVEESRLSQFPTLKLMLGKVSTNWYPPSYLYPASVPSQKRTYCFGFDDNGSHGGSVLGATWMVDHEIVFDIKKKRIGVADLSCPVYKTRPKAPKPSDFETEMPTAAPQTNATDMTAPPNATDLTTVEPDDTQTTSKPADTQT